MREATEELSYVGININAFGFFFLFLYRDFPLPGAVPLRRDDMVGDLSWGVSHRNSQTLQLSGHGVQISPCRFGCTKLLCVFRH